MQGHRFSPGSGKLPDAEEQLSSCTTTPEPELPEPLLHDKRSPHNAKPVHHGKKVACGYNKAPCSQTQKEPEEEFLK